MVFVKAVRIKRSSAYTEAEKPDIPESAVHHTAVVGHHSLKFHIDDIEIDKIKLSDF